MPKCPSCGNEIVDIRGHVLDSSEVEPAHADDQLELLITAELPGVDEKDVQVKVSDRNTLTIRGQKKVESAKEGDDGIRSFRRSIRLPFEVREEKIDATLNDGVLTIRVQKPAKLRKVERAIRVERSGNGSDVVSATMWSPSSSSGARGAS
jgi:HSP20 family molecular chaperone IbpA